MCAMEESKTESEPDLKIEFQSNKSVEKMKAICKTLIQVRWMGLDQAKKLYSNRKVNQTIS